MTRKRSIFLLLMLSVALAGGCYWRRSDPKGLDPLPPPRHPVYIANAIELRMTAIPALADERRRVNILLTGDGAWHDRDFRRVWSVLRRKLEAHDHLQIYPQNAAVGCDYRLDARMERSADIPVVKLVLTDCASGEVIWTHAEKLALAPVRTETRP